MERPHIKFLGLLAIAGMTACAALFGIQGGVLDADASADAAPDVSFDGGFVPDGNTADCGSATRTLQDAGLFVSPLGAGTSCTQTQPCTSIKTAIGLAQQDGYTIYLDTGTYTSTLEFDQNSRKLSIEGGWKYDSSGNTWTPSCDNTLATIQRDPANPAEYAVHLNNDPNALTLRLVRVTNAVPAGSDGGTSVYGVVSNTSTIVLDNVAIVVGNALPGVNGQAQTAQQQLGCIPTASDGQNGPPGITGSPGAITATSIGFDNWSNPASPGQNGSQGHNGTAGGPGTTINCVACGLHCDASSVCTLDSTGTATGGDGIPGCGGNPGYGGYPAGGVFNVLKKGNAGSSVALYLWGGNAILTNVTLKAGNAGSGGAGGAGAGGAQGASGATGTTSGCNTGGTCGTSGACPSAFCSGAMAYSPAFGGSPGGDGGAGGAGGQGGGGAGGHSFTYFAGNQANVTLNGTPLTQYGQAGSGGAPNGPNGEAGVTNP